MGDSRVKEAQVWVNKTYKQKINDTLHFPPILEDGITGWKTIHALTRALQWEIGIEPEDLSDNFGPTTMAILENRDGIGEMNGGDIVQLVQCAFYCKGYSSGRMDGDWRGETTEAATKMCFDAGVTSGQELKSLKPKMLKGLFSMDAYTKLPMGTESIRSVQRWLNGRYLDFLNYSIVPADGISSRDVQRGLYIAIQFEMGLSPTAATGSFGPATRKFLKEHPIRVSQSGFLVQIFTGAMVCQKFNQVTFLGLNEVFTGFSSTFVSDTSKALVDFQQFSELPKTGEGDFATWCQLLVSTGDPDRPTTAFDCSETFLTASTAAMMRSAGYQFVGRYVANAPGSTFNKMIQPGELAAIFGAGLRLFPIFQFGGGDLSHFDYGIGRIHGSTAHAAAFNHGFPAGTVIYFAVDFDATQAEINSNVDPYFRGVAGALARRGKRYIMGVYGSRNVCSDISVRLGARWSFVAGMSSGYSGNMGFAMPSNWSFNQIQTTSLGPLKIDRDVHKQESDMGVDGVASTTVASVEEFITYIRKVYNLAIVYRSSAGCSSVGLSEMVLNFLRHPTYTGYRWWALLGVVDGLVYKALGGFISYAEAGRISKVDFVRDPTSGVVFHVSHFAAACIAVLLRGRPLQPGGVPPEPGAADFAGWGGDWIQHYGLWQDALSLEPTKWYSGLVFCRARLAKTEEEMTAGSFDSTFKLRDLIEDVVGFNIGMRLRITAPVATNIVDEIIYAFQGSGRLLRYQDFYAKRFNSIPLEAKKAATSMLLPHHQTGPDDSVVMQLGQSLLVTEQCEDPVMAWDMPSDRLSMFCDGFVETLTTKVEAEKMMAS